MGLHPIGYIAQAGYIYYYTAKSLLCHAHKQNLNNGEVSGESACIEYYDTVVKSGAINGIRHIAQGMVFLFHCAASDPQHHITLSGTIEKYIAISDTI